MRLSLRCGGCRKGVLRFPTKMRSFWKYGLDPVTVCSDTYLSHTEATFRKVKSVIHCSGSSRSFQFLTDKRRSLTGRGVDIKRYGNEAFAASECQMEFHTNRIKNTSTRTFCTSHNTQETHAIHQDASYHQNYASKPGPHWSGSCRRWCMRAFYPKTTLPFLGLRSLKGTTYLNHLHESPSRDSVAESNDF